MTTEFPLVTDKYTLINDDSLIYLEKFEDNSIENFITGIPDMNEVNMDLDNYINFFYKSARLIFKKLSKTGYAIFVQTDRKINGTWLSKFNLLTNISKEFNLNLMWHKIVLQRDVGSIHLQRPTFSNIMCYSFTNKPGKCFNDVFHIGNKLYENATPENVAEKLVIFLKEQGQKSVFDPFVGMGTVGKFAVIHDLQFLGIDISKSQCILANNLISNFINNDIKEESKTITKTITKTKLKLKKNNI